MANRRQFLKAIGSGLAFTLAAPSLIKSANATSAQERLPSRFDFKEPLEVLNPTGKQDRLVSHSQLLKERFGPQNVPTKDVFLKNNPQDVKIEGGVFDFVQNGKAKSQSKVIEETNLQNLTPTQFVRDWKEPNQDDMRYLLKNAPKSDKGLALIRALWIRNPHTNEEVKCVFWNNGVYDNDAYAKVCVLMRDWREKTTMAMDPLLMHIIWRIQSDVNYDAPVNINSAYRTIKTNQMLMKEGAAQNSQHLNARAVDIGIPGYPPKAVGDRAVELGIGGVGFYRTFTHIDTGNKRYW